MRQQARERPKVRRNFSSSSPATAVLTRPPGVVESVFQQLEAKPPVLVPSRLEVFEDIRTSITPSPVIVPSRPGGSFLDDLSVGVLPPLLVPSRANRFLVGPSAPATVVDCGSGSTRAIFLQPDAASPRIHRSKSDWRAEALASALQDERRARALASMLADSIPEGPVLIGATAGVRHAIDTGLVHEPQVDVFTSCLQEFFGDRVEFAVLSGPEEARAEWEALEYLLKELHEQSGHGKTPPTHIAGMLSGGGMSCQLAVRGRNNVASGEPRVLSFKNFVLTPGGIVDRASDGDLLGSHLREALERYEASTLEALEGLPRQEEGTFALAEWVALYVAGKPTDRDKSMGLGYEQLHSYTTVAAALESHLQQLLGSTSPSEPVPRATVVALAYGTVIRATLRQIFSDKVSFYAVKGVNWATGHYLLAHRTGAWR